MESKKTSLIITVYNRVHLLRKSLLSLMNQSKLPSELIISDDGSDEDIIGGISDIIELLNFPIRYIRQPHNGFRLARCRNNGVRNSSGEFLIFLDQDILHTKDFIRTFNEHKKEKRFITSYPVRLTEVQSEMITEESIKDFSFINYVNKNQKNKIRRQFIKDYISFLGYKLYMVKQKPKLRGGVCAINRVDYLQVNGYDEKFNGWGNEDDDLRRRLYRAGVSGYNPFINDYPLHLYHKPFHQDGKRVNTEYNNLRIKEISKGDFYCQQGVNSALKEDLEIIKIN